MLDLVLYIFEVPSITSSAFRHDGLLASVAAEADQRPKSPKEITHPSCFTLSISLEEIEALSGQLMAVTCQVY
jgi:hypothetical protein